MANANNQAAPARPVHPPEQIELDVQRFSYGDEVEYLKFMERYRLLRDLKNWDNRVASQFIHLRILLSGEALKSFEHGITSFAEENPNVGETEACLQSALGHLDASFLPKNPRFKMVTDLNRMKKSIDKLFLRSFTRLFLRLV